MARQMAARGNGGRQRRAAHQMELFAGGAKASSVKPSWLDLPEHARAALIGLMTQLMRQHVLAISAREAGDDR